MEQWEREYLEIIRENKERIKNSDKPVSKKRKEYIEACWQEVVRADGTKYYIPDKKKLDRQIKKRKQKENTRRIKTRISKGIKNILKILLALLVITTLVKSAGLSGNGNILRMLLPVSRLSMSSSDINGILFSIMMDTLVEIENTHGKTMSSSVSSGYCFTQDQIEQWLADIDTDVQRLKNMKYHKSYEEVVNSYSEFLITTRNIVVCLEYGSGNIREELDHYNAILKDMKASLIEAFEKNNIPYTDTETALSYQYIVY